MVDFEMVPRRRAMQSEDSSMVQRPQHRGDLHQVHSGRQHRHLAERLNLHRLHEKQMVNRNQVLRQSFKPVRIHHASHPTVRPDSCTGSRVAIFAPLEEADDEHSNANQT